MPAGGLPFPVSKRVELARALAGNPKLLLLDEPAAGLNHDEVDVLRGQIRRVRDTQHVTVLLVEHHMSLVMSVSDKVVAIDFGRKIAEGTPAEVQRNAGRDPRLSRDGGVSVAALLEVEGLKAFYGQTQALHDVSFSLEPGGITTLLGANGAGKTTTLRAICGMVRTEGAITFDGQPINGRATEEIVRLRRRPRAGGARHLHQPQRRREPARCRLHAPRQGRRRARPRHGLRVFPDPQGAPCPAGRHAVGRRAADAGDQPRADAGARA